MPVLTLSPLNLSTPRTSAFGGFAPASESLALGGSIRASALGHQRTGLPLGYPLSNDGPRSGRMAM